MESKAKLVDASKNIFSQKWRLTFELEGQLPEMDNISGKDLRLTAIQWREKRSLNANAYAHVLLGQIAKEAGISLTEAKNRLLAEWGQYDTTEDGKPMTVIMREDIPWEKLDLIHLRPTKKTKILDDHRLYRVYIVIAGSHTYDTATMARFIDGIVQEAQQLGIETLTPDKLERMKAAWHPE